MWNSSRCEGLDFHVNIYRLQSSTHSKTRLFSLVVKLQTFASILPKCLSLLWFNCLQKMCPVDHWWKFPFICWCMQYNPFQLKSFKSFRYFDGWYFLIQSFFLKKLHGSIMGANISEGWIVELKPGNHKAFLYHYIILMRNNFH